MLDGPADAAMAQVFRKETVLLIKLGLIAAMAAAAAVVAIYAWYARSLPPQDDALLQPIPFSHKHHVGDDGIDCRYCHTRVEESRSAGLPTAHVCLSCHSQLYSDQPLLAALRASAASARPVRWQRVHDLPDFVYFDHSIHLAKGVACAECHGRVDQMPRIRRVAPLEMQWCLDCHRDPQARLRPESVVFRPDAADDPARLSAREREILIAHLQSGARRTDCSTCHR
ncbi:MAG: cytochrome c3 family protein [Gammaproteobacteria bacterium]